MRVALEENNEYKLTHDLTEEEVTRLGIFALEMPQAPPSPGTLWTSCRHASRRKMHLNRHCGTRHRTHRRHYIHPSIPRLHRPLHLHLDDNA